MPAPGVRYLVLTKGGRIDIDRVRKLTDTNPNPKVARPRPETGGHVPGVGSSSYLLELQRFAGNRAIARMMATPTVQRDTPNPLERVQKAIASSNLDELITIEHDLRGEMAKDPLSPPQDVRAALATARCWAMDRVAVIRDRYMPMIEALGSGATTGTDTTGEREKYETRMDDECTPFLNVLMEGHPEYRYQHFNDAVRQKVFSAVRLHASRRGLAQVGHRAAAEAEARTEGGLPSGAWCGVFAYTQAEKAGGFDPHWKGLMQGEGGIRSALAYAGDMANTWIWAFDHWESLKAYHTRVGSPRWYEAIGKSPPSRGIEAGDLVLIDSAFGKDPDHITTAVSFDGRYLRTIGGNQASNSPTDEKGVSTSGPYDLTKNPEPNDVTMWVTGPDGKKKKAVDPSKGPKNTRVHGVGRWSLVDFEQHVYRVSPSVPTKPPTTKEVAAVT